MKEILPSELPITTVCDPSISFNGFFLAKSALAFSDGSGKDVAISGYSFSPSADTAKYKSIYEVYERFFAHYAFAETALGDQIELNNFFGEKSGIFAETKKIAVGTGYMDASGLSFHRSFEEAREHALHEIIERHFLALWWYKNQPLAMIDGESKKLPGMTMEFYTSCHIDIPFVLCVLRNDVGTTWLCGSSLKRNYHDAVSHAGKEAMMLYEGISGGLQGPEVEIKSHNTQSEDRLRSLMDVAFVQERQKYLEETTTGKPKKRAKKDYSVKEIMMNMKMGIDDIDLALFHRSEEGVVLRALNPDLLSLRSMRDSMPTALFDPFC